MVTDLSKQMDEVNRKLDLLLTRIGESSNQSVKYAIPDFLASLPVKDDESFCNLNDHLKLLQNKQAIVSLNLVI